MLTYTMSFKNNRGLHIEFNESITPANFLAACNTAIDLARVECSTQNVVAIVFAAQDLEVQVTEADSAEVQLALWERKMSNCIEPATESKDKSVSALKHDLPADQDPRFREQIRQLEEITEILKSQMPISKCSDCGAETDHILGCPDGAEICQDCFDSGSH